MTPGAIDQATLRRAILDPAATVPPGIVDGSGRPAPRRFGVYRNNVAVSLGEALEAAFPVVRKLVGSEFFRAMAGVFLRAHPPRSPLMMLYGDELPGFLATFPPVAHLPYLSDVARLEQALRESYHAADAVPVAPADLARVPAALERSRLRFAPALRLIRSPFPVYGIWRANTAGAPAPAPRPEDVLVTRPGHDPVATHLPVGGAILAALIDGKTIAEAAEAEDPSALQALFSALLAADAIVDIEGETP